MSTEKEKFEALKTAIRTRLTKSQIRMELEDNYYITIEDFEGYNWIKEEGVILLANAWLEDTKMENCNSIFESLIKECIN